MEQRFWSTYGSQGLNVVGINSDDEDYAQIDRVKAFVDTLHITYPVGVRASIAACVPGSDTPSATPGRASPVRPGHGDPGLRCPIRTALRRRPDDLQRMFTSCIMVILPPLNGGTVARRKALAIQPLVRVPMVGPDSIRVEATLPDGSKTTATRTLLVLPPVSHLPAALVAADSAADAAARSNLELSAAGGNSGAVPLAV
jgi:hypothetical protein